MNDIETTEGKLQSLVKEANLIFTAWFLERDGFRCKCCGKKTMFTGGPQNMDYMRESLHYPNCQGLRWAHKVVNFFSEKEG